MGLRFKLNALAAVVLAVLFYSFFMTTKHDPVLSLIVPFGDDPYDAVGSFCLILSVLLALLSLARTQLAIPIGILAALAADAIALVRHASMWMGKAGASELGALLLGMTALCLASVYLIRRTAHGIELPRAPSDSRRTTIAVLAFVVGLAVFPEQIIHSVSLHFLAILLSFALIAACQATLS